MNWLTPFTGLILAASVIPPLLLLYFLKLRRRPQPIACTLLWKRSIEDLRANAPFQRLRRSLLLFLQLIALLLLAASVMQPQLQSGRQRGGRTVFLIDNSASMTAVDTEDGGSRLDEAKRRAKERIEAMYGGGLLSRAAGETMIVTFASHAEIASRFSSSKQELLAAVDRIRPTHGVTNLAEALKLARAYTTNVDPDSDRPVGDPAALEIFTDGRIADLSEQVLKSGESLDYHRVGGLEADNVAFGAISVERPYDRPTAVEVFAALLNYNREAISCDVQISVDETAIGVEELRLPAATIDEVTGVIRPGRNNAVFTPFEQPDGAVIEVANLRSDDLAADNATRIVVPPPKQLTVGLVPPDSFFVKEMLEGMPLRRLELLSPGQYEALVESGGLDAYDVIVFDGYAPPDGLMPPGRYLSFGATPPVAGLNEFGVSESQVVLNTRDESPALRFVRIDNLYISEAKLLQPDDEIEVLIEGSQGPLVLNVARGPMQVLHVTFRPEDSNWPLLRSWVTFIFNAVEYLGHIGEGLTTQGLSVGEAITARLPSTAADIRLLTPEGSIDELTALEPSFFSWGPIRLSGLYLLSWTGPDGDPDMRPFAVNLLSEPEGLVEAVEMIEIGQDQFTGAGIGESAYTPLWPYAIGLCLAVLMLEWWVYHRKTFI